MKPVVAQARRSRRCRHRHRAAGRARQDPEVRGSAPVAQESTRAAGVLLDRSRPRSCAGPASPSPAPATSAWPTSAWRARAPRCALSAIVDPSPAAPAHADAGRRAAVPLARRAVAPRIGRTAWSSPRRTRCTCRRRCECIAAGLPILLEKPIAPTVAEASGWSRPSRRAGARVLIGHHRAHSPIMAKAKQVVASGVLGELVAVMGSATFFKPDHYFADAPWRRETGRRPDPAQHDPRGAQPAHAVRRDRRRAGLRLARDARLRGRGHGGDQPALRQRRARHLHAERHRRLRRAAGSRPRRRTRPTRATTTRTAT